MPSIVTEDGSFPETIEVPDDGEGATSASLEDTFVQDLANRTRHSNTVTEVSGVRRIRMVVDRAALKAVTGMATGDVRHVDGLGLYFFDLSLAIAEASPWVLAPNVGSGRWVHQMAGFVADFTGGGVATYNSTTGKVINPVPNRIVASYLQKRTPAVEDADEQITSTTSLTFVDAPVQVGVTSGADEVQAGDKIVISASVRVFCNATAFVRLRVADLDGGIVVATPLTECWGRINPAEDADFAWTTEHVAGTGLPRTFGVFAQIRTTSAVKPVYLYKPSIVRIQIIRP